MAIEEVLQELNEILKELGKHEEICSKAATWIEEIMHYLNRNVEKYTLMLRSNDVCIKGSLWHVCYGGTANTAVKQVYEHFFDDARQLTSLLKFTASGLKACADTVLTRIEELKKRVKILESQLKRAQESKVNRKKFKKFLSFFTLRSGKRE